MALAEQACTVVRFGGETVPYADSIAGAIVMLLIAMVYLIQALPVATELVPVIGAFLSGFELGEHTAITVIVLYLLVSIAVVTELLPFCQI